MPFENFYKADEEHRRKFRQAVGMSIIFLTLYWTIPLALVYWKKRRELDAQIELQNQWLKTAVNVCDSLPIPPEFDVISQEKPIIGENNASIAFRIKGKRKLVQVNLFYSDWLESRGWKKYSSKEKIFSGELGSVEIEDIDIYNSEYSIKCSKGRLVIYD